VDGTLRKGLLAGIMGTAAMTAAQLAVAKAQGRPVSTRVPRTWNDAPPPAKVVKQAAEAVGQGQRVTKRRVPMVTNALHWLYGSFWGPIYGVVAEQAHPNPLRGGVALGTGVWGAAYAELVPLGIYQPPWRYPVKELATDVGFHLIYGLAVAGTYAALDGRG
jgi:uncharacterized membrane protein YagU involved in acid resistance